MSWNDPNWPPSNPEDGEEFNKDNPWGPRQDDGSDPNQQAPNVPPPGGHPQPGIGDPNPTQQTPQQGFDYGNPDTFGQNQSLGGAATSQTGSFFEQQPTQMNQPQGGYGAGTPQNQAGAQGQAGWNTGAQQPVQQDPNQYPATQAYPQQGADTGYVAAATGAAGYAGTQVGQGYATPQNDLSQYSGAGRKQKPSGLPMGAWLGGGLFLLLIAGLAAYFLFLRDSGEDVATPTSDTVVDSTESTIGDGAVTPGDAAVSLVVDSAYCLADDCTVSGPLDASQPNAYRIVVQGNPPPAFTLRIDGNVVEDPNAAFGFVDQPGKHLIEVIIDGGETTTFNQFAFSPPSTGSYVILTSVPRVDGVPAAIAQLDQQAQVHESPVLSEGAYFNDPENYLVYVGGFAAEDEANTYCADNGIAPEACRVANLVPPDEG